MALRSIFPFIEVMSKVLPFPVFKKATEAGARIRNYADQSIKRYKGIIDQNPIDPKPTLFTKLYNPGRDGKEGLTDQEIVREAVGYIAAGSDTTAVTLTYLIFGVCINPEVQKKLVAEVSNLPDNLQHKDVQDLPYLNAVLNETLRLYPATPSPLPRVVPAQGAELSGHHIPGGTIVSSQAYSLHRNEDAFPNPEKYAIADSRFVLED
jgi:cytochrome P450